MRLRNNPDAMPFLQEHADLVFINPRDHLGKWYEVFGNNNPIAIEIGMGKNWRWLAKIFAFFGAGVGLFGIGTFTQVNSISSAVKNFFDPESSNVVFSAFGHDYTMATVVTGLILTLCVGLVVIGGIKRIAKVS